VAQGNATTDGEASPERAIAPPSSAAESSQHRKIVELLRLLGIVPRLLMRLPRLKWRAWYRGAG